MSTSPLAAPLASLLAARASPPDLLALGEPTHWEPAFPVLRNRMLALLVGHGVRSIAIESDAVAALAVDAFVRGEGGTLDGVMGEGFSHGFGRLDANRELVTWLRAHNDGVPPAERVAFHGFDAPLEMESAPSPRPYLQHLHDYLTRHLGPGALLHRGAELHDRLGDDARWSDPAAVMDPARSAGASADAAALRVAADDLLTALTAGAPALVAASSPADWRRAELHGRAALGLLRYHAQAAAAVAPAARIARLSQVRDALMAEHLLAISARERHRGPTLVFAHNLHLQRHASTWRDGDVEMVWHGAGAIVATLLRDRYVFVAGSLGAGGRPRLAPPAPGTFEGALSAAGDGPALLPAADLAAILGRDLRARTDVTPGQHLFPLDAATLADADAVLHVPEGGRPTDPDPTPVDLAARVLALPEVTQVVADAASGAPEIAWGDRFFSVGTDGTRPFATIVTKDYPGFDEDSRLDRPGVFRLNIELGREAFTREFGYQPAAAGAHRAAIDPARLDEVLPHPVYGAQGWACVLSPTAPRLGDIDRLLTSAHARALARHHRTPGRAGDPGRVS
jgi:erythromycin esterase-like protein